MQKLVASVFASASVLALAHPARAEALQPPPAQASAQPETPPTLSEVVVTARRRSENLQGVPQTVNVVSAEALQKFEFHQFQDIQAVVPGLSLAQNGSGYQAAASLRGVTFDVSTGAQPTVALYLNDAPVQALFLFQSLFDVGQVEVLRGPQGTTRGVSAPSGAITLTTRPADPKGFGGYADLTATDLQGRIFQAALNAPLIKDVLAVRVAGVIDRSDLDGVRSLHDAVRPRQSTAAERISLAFTPDEQTRATVTYQHLDKSIDSFDQVSGPGQGDAANPAISPKQRLSVEDGPNMVRQHFDVLTAQAETRIFGQRLSYVGSYQKLKINTDGALDIGDVLPGTELYSQIQVAQKQTTQELRLASEPEAGRLIDYTLGAFYNWQDNGGHITNPGPLLPGAFGDPRLGVDLAAFDARYQVPVGIDVPSTLQETSFFGALTFHLGSRTELSGGARHLFSIVKSRTRIATSDGLVALPPSFANADSCAAAQLPSTYPGLCDVTLDSAMVVSDGSTRTSETPTVYNLSLSHRLMRGLLLYANTGTSYRPPVASIGIQGDLANNGDPALSTLTFHPSETSRAYEVGFKATFWGGRARLDASAFRQKFKNLTIFVPGVSYLNTIPTPAQSTVFNFTATVDALVTGFDLDSAVQITPFWNLSAQLSYADGKLRGSQAPCNVTDAAGQPVYNTEGLISLCPGGPSSRLPLWNASIQTEYIRPVSDRIDGFVRGLVTYFPQNKNRVEPDFTVGKYSLLNLYAGVRSQDGAWEVALFARNAFKVQRTLDVQGVPSNVNAQLSTAFPELIRPSGYFPTLVTPRREVGINVHYAWGRR